MNNEIEELDNEGLVKEVTNYYYEGFTNHKEEIDNKVCARKVVTNLKDGHPQYFIKMEGAEFYDPNNISPRYVKKFWKFRRVSDRAFGLYLLFLGHPNKTHLGQQSYKFKAERETL